MTSDKTFALEYSWTEAASYPQTRCRKKKKQKFFLPLCFQKGYAMQIVSGFGAHTGLFLL